MNDGEMVALPPDRLRESRKPINPWSVLIGLMLVCASSQAIAQVCEAEHQAAVREEPANALLKIRPSDPGSLERILVFKADYDPLRRELAESASGTGIKKRFPDIERNLRGLQLWEKSQEMNVRDAGQLRGAFFQRYLLCVIRAQISVLERGSSPPSQPTQVCEAERQRLRTLSNATTSGFRAIDRPINVLMNETIPRTMQDFSNYLSYGCGGMKMGHDGIRTFSPSAPPICNAFKDKNRPPAPTSPNYGDALLLMADIYTKKAKELETSQWGAEQLVYACVARHMAAQIKRTSVTPPSPSSPANTVPGGLSPDQIISCNREILAVHRESKSWPGNANDVKARLGRVEIELFEGRCAGHPNAQAWIKSGNLKLAGAGSTTDNENRDPAGTPGATHISQDVNRATALAQKRQAELDRARQGKPKRHQAGLEAHQCLKPQQGGGVINACPYAVEYIYCVYRPTRGSDSGFMDCEKNGGGMWHIGAGPNSQSIMHTSGETTYWFACKYGETLDKPDGGSAVDVHFQVGRGLLGRCA